MAFTILRSGKYKAHASINKLTAHNFRVTPEKVKGLKPENSHLNITKGCQTPEELKAKLKERIASCSRKARPDANKMVEFMMTASPEFFEGKSYEESKAYLEDGLDYVTKMYGEANILSATFHFDEKTPHVHIMVVPIETSIRKTKYTEKTVTCLNAKAFIDGPAHLVKIQDHFAQFIKDRGHDLERGVSKFETGAVHVPVPQYWDEKVKEINATNAAAADLLDQTAIETKKATDLRREVEHSHSAIEFERKELADKIKAVDGDLARAREAKLTAQKLEAMSFQKAAELEVEKMKLSKRSKTLSEKLTDVKTIKERYETRIQKLASSTELMTIATTPDLAPMVRYLNENPEAREVLTLLKRDPDMTKAVLEALQPQGLVNAPSKTDWSNAEDFSWMSHPSAQTTRTNDDFSM